MHQSQIHINSFVKKEGAVELGGSVDSCNMCRVLKCGEVSRANRIALNVWLNICTFAEFLWFNGTYAHCSLGAHGDSGAVICILINLNRLILRNS